MPDTIGAISCNSLAGAYQPAIPATQEWQQFGEDGNGLWIGNVRQQQVELISTHAVADIAAANTLRGSAKALVGTAVTITRNSVATANCLVKSVIVDKSVAAAGLPSPNAWVVVLRWSVLLPTSV